VLFDELNRPHRRRRRHRPAGALDGALIVLHGAMGVEDVPDADAEIPGRVRAAIGADRPVVATSTCTPTLSPGLVAAPDMLVGYRTNPHVDMAERGAEAARGSPSCWRPALPRRVPQAAAGVGVADPGHRRRTDALDHARARDEAVAALGLAGASVAVGYPYSDVRSSACRRSPTPPRPRRRKMARSASASAIWARRAAFVPDVVAGAAAVAAALELGGDGRGPAILVDVADNIGGGTPGDGTVALAGLLEARARDAAVVLCDPPAARRARALGVGARFARRGRRRTDRMHGDPVRSTARSPSRRGRVPARGPWMTGQSLSSARSRASTSAGFMSC
jgi:microcystin degradation protein MlrC